MSFWHAVYQASEGYAARVGWTGNYTSTAAGAEGNTSAAFIDDTERRLNYFRAMCGVSANVRINSGSTVYISPSDTNVPAATTTKAEASQRSAFMISRTYSSGSTNFALSHDPVQGCVGWTTAAWNANANGNVAQGFYGPGAINAFVQENVPGLSTWNAAVGHRRWTLMQRATDYATGNSPGSYTSATNKVVPPASTLYVTQKAGEMDSSVAPKFTCYPAPGYFPAPLNSQFWSVTYPNANFNSAKVTVTSDSGSAVVATIVSRNAAYADNTLVWQMSANASVQQVADDTKFNVTVTDIAGEGIPSSLSYSVILIDPNQLVAAPVLSGPAHPSTEGTAYHVTPVPGAETMQTGMFLKHVGTWVESAEDPTPAVIPHTDPGYNFIDSTAGYTRTGSKAFRLASPPYDVLSASIPDQSFELDREILAGAGGKLNFYYRRSYMAAGSRLAVEISSDQGSTWTGIGTDIAGTANGLPDNGFQTSSVSLPASTMPVRARFRFYYSGNGGLYTFDDARAKPNGIFIDDISTSGCDELERTAIVSTTTQTSVIFSPATANATLEAGQEWWLRERAVLGGHPFPYGPALVVIPIQALQLSGQANPPAGGGASYTFVPVSSADSYKLEVETLGQAGWTEGAEDSPAPLVQDDTSASYDLISNKAGYFSTGAKSFRLGLATAADTDDSFTILRTFVPIASSNLMFWIRKGKMSATNTVSAEVSENGNTWNPVWSVAGKTTADAAGSVQTISLAAYAGKNIKVRFAVRKGATANMAWNATDSGAWIDDIHVDGAWSSMSEKDTMLPASSVIVRLDAGTAGQPLQSAVPVRMRMSAIKGGVAESSGPYFTATPTGTPVTGFAGWVAYDYPLLLQGFTGDDDGDGLSNGLAYAFGLDPTQSQPLTPSLVVGADQTIQLSQPLDAMRTGITYGAEWSGDLVHWSAAGVSVQMVDGRVVASAPVGSGSRFLRWAISQP
ncbi:MAG: hypothetical protein JWO82_3457 [Akkermansiaceae bacterium]|nr:hypothetical protein [Akkermansiaceae bacterium]